MCQSKVQNATVHTDCFVQKTVQSPNIFIKYIGTRTNISGCLKNVLNSIGLQLTITVITD